MEKCGIVRYNQLYRGVSDPIKLANIVNQTVYNINKVNNSLSSISDDIHAFSEAYNDSGSDIKQIQIIEDEQTKSLQFLPLSSASMESFNATIQDIESMIKYCNKKLGDLS